MSSPRDNDITLLLRDWSNGDTQARMAREPGGGAGMTLQPTALVHEAYLRFAQQQAGKEWTDRTHFFAVAARVVRAVLVDHARARGAVKRGDGAIGVELEESHQTVNAPAVDILDLNTALDALEAMHPEHCRIVELRYFAGLSIEETAAALQLSPSTVKRGWLAAKTWIRQQLDRRK